MTTHELSVPVSSLDAGGKSFTFPIRPAWVRGVVEGCNITAVECEGKLEVRLSTSGRDVVATGHLSAEIEVPCARCLGPARVEIEHDFSVLFVPETSQASRDDEDEVVGSEDPDTVPYDGETVVLDDLVRDELILETPMIPLCSESCPGMSPSLPRPDRPEGSKGEAIDPRLLPLMRWKTPSK